MKLEEAIEILESSLDNLDPFGEGEIGCAAKLGIEALKRVQKGRRPQSWLDSSTLPGETKD